LEGGYVAEQLADRAGAKVHKVELLQLADEKYPIRAERLEDVIRAAAGTDVDHIALLTPRQVIPAGLVEHLQSLYGKDGVVDAQELYYRVKYEKSEIEMRLIADASVIADAMLRAMLAVLSPGRLETEVAGWGAWVGRMLGSERDGFQIMVGANRPTVLSLARPSTAALTRATGSIWVSRRNAMVLRPAFAALLSPWNPR
jgi:Xaa-Pro aminopeptidase